MQETHQEMR